MSGADSGLEEARKIGAALHDVSSVRDSFAYSLSRLDDSAGAGSAEDASSKILYLVRHAEGEHNRAVRETGSEEEYKNWAWLDSRLTARGREQCEALRKRVDEEKLVPEVVLVSPLSRAVETGRIGFGSSGARKEALDVVRERIGTHPCDKRRSRTELSADFPDVDFSTLQAEDDDVWTEEREPWPLLVRRAEVFLRVARLRPERALAVVAHNDFLTALLHDVPPATLAVPDALRVSFGNADVHAVRLAWRERPAAESAPHSPLSESIEDQ